MPADLMAQVESCGKCSYESKPIVLIPKSGKNHFFILFECCGTLFETKVIGMGYMKAKIRMKK